LRKEEEMKRRFVYPLSVVLVFIVSQIIPFVNVNAEELALLNVDDVIKNVDPDRVNKAQFKEYYGTVEGEQAKGEGIVVSFLPGGKYKNRIAILTSASKPDKKYNVVLFTNQDAADLKKGDAVMFEGEIGHVTPFGGASIDIYGTYKKHE
jgi:hypothetical protein